jgi:hypothetical protein
VAARRGLNLVYQSGLPTFRSLNFLKHDDSAAIPKSWAQTTGENAKYRALGENFVWNHGDDSHLCFVLNEPREPTRSYPQEAHM